MVAYGWTEEHLREACAYATEKIREAGGVQIGMRHVEIKTYECRRGNATIGFTLNFFGSTARRKDGSYPAGVAYKTELRSWVLPKQPIPMAEVIDIRQKERHSCGRQYELKAMTRSTGSLCWHTFGHFMAKLFQLNPAGKLSTGEESYDGVASFRVKAAYNRKQDRQDCDCGAHGLVDFFEVAV